jgi:hypothetical protein
MASDITRYLFRFRSEIQRRLAESQAKAAGLSLNAWIQNAVDISATSRFSSEVEQPTGIGSSNRGQVGSRPTVGPNFDPLNIPGVSRGFAGLAEAKEAACPECGQPSGEKHKQTCWNAIPDGPIVEIPICGKDWWEDGEHYECLMDKHHKNPKHGQAGMVRRLKS